MTTIVEELVKATIHSIQTQRELKKPARILVLVRPVRYTDYLDLLVKELITHLNLKEEYFQFTDPAKRLHRINYDFLGYDFIDVVRTTQQGPVAWIPTGEQTHTLFDTGAE